MTSEDQTLIDSIFNQAIKQPWADRGVFLRSVCGENDALLREVESLLAAAAEMGEDFLAEPILGSCACRGEPKAIGSYRILRTIGCGGMGKVYLATRADTTYRQEVAIKVLRRGLDTEEIIRRFYRERQLLARLEHSYIVKILDGGTTEDSLPYFVMEYVEGETIDQYCAARGLPLRALLKLFREVCSAVGFAHQNLVVHRDLKPENILIDGLGQPKLLDFGIAKLLEPGHVPVTRSGIRPMTPGYASPEQVEGGPITTASDIYSLGCLLHDLLTGSVEHSADRSQTPSKRREADGELRSPSQSAGCGHLAGDLDSIVMKALEQDPANRYASTEHLAEDLTRYLDGLPVRARQATLGYRLGKFIQRHRIGAAISAGMLVVIVGFGIGMTILWDQAVHEHRRAETERRRAEGVTQFLVEVFQNPDPKESRGEDVTARQLLDKSSVDIYEKVDVDSETRVALMDAMSQAYLGLELYRDAEPLLEESLRLREENAQTSPEALATNLFNLARVRSAMDRNHEAIELAHTAVQLLRGQGDSPFLARALNNTALLLKKQGDVRASEDLQRESLEMKIRLLGETHEDVATSQHNLAAVLREQGKYQEAEKFYRESLALKVALHGRHSPEVATTLNSLALLLMNRDQLEDVEPILLEVLDIRHRVYGPDHPKTGTARVNLGAFLRRRQRWHEAEIQLEDALRIYSLAGKETSSVANVVRHLALLKLAQGQAEEAESKARRAVQILRRTMGEGHWQVAEAESVLGACLLALGRYEQASGFLKGSYQTLEATRGSAALQTRQALERLEQLSAEHRQ